MRSTKTQLATQIFKYIYVEEKMFRNGTNINVEIILNITNRR